MSIEPTEECNFQQCQNDPYSPSSSNISRVHKYHYKLFYFIIRTIVKKKVKAVSYFEVIKVYLLYERSQFTHVAELLTIILWCTPCVIQMDI